MTKAAELAKMGEVLTNSQIGGRRNIVINGDAQCWQRATSASSTGYTSIDRWSYYAPSSLAISRSTDVPTGFQYAISIGGGGDSSGITQKIEASTCKQLVGETITISFHLKQTTGSGTDKIAVALSRADSEDNFGGTTSISSQTISTTSSYERYTLTFTSLPTEVANGLQLTIKSNGSGSVVYLITGIQLEVGSQATPFEHRSFGEELALCQRYFFKTFPHDTTPAAGETDCLYHYIQDYSGGYTVFNTQLPSMRATPSVVFYTTASSSNGTGRISYWDSGWKNGTVSLQGQTSSENASGEALTGTNLLLMQYNLTADAEL